MSPRSGPLALLATLVALTGCGQDPAPVDAGAPAPADAGMDASVADAGPVERCTGTPTGCATLDLASCESVTGCRVSQCRGVAVACADYAQQAQCDATAGCRWNGSACGGRETPCAAFDDEAACGAQMGCGWATSPACRGAATPCEDLTGAACARQPGCTLSSVGPGVLDAGGLDAQAFGGDRAAPSRTGLGRGTTASATAIGAA